MATNIQQFNPNVSDLASRQAFQRVKKAISQLSPFVSTIPPVAATDTISKGFLVGSLWLDTTSHIFYVCTKNTAPATWQQIGGTNSAAGQGGLASGGEPLVGTDYLAVYDVSLALNKRTTLAELLVPMGGQPLDTGLTSMAALPTAADKMPYSTATDVWAETAITAAARTVLDDATVGAMVDTLGGASATGTGGLVRATSPTLVAPALGTPASGVLTNCTELPVAGLANGTDGELITWDASGVAATVAVGTATHVLTSNGVGAAPTFQAAAAGYTDEQAQDAVGAMCTDTTLVYTDATPLLARAALTGVVTCAAGSNATAIADAALSIAKTSGLQAALDLKAALISPSLVTPALGTPSAGVLTNCTGLPVGGATFAATDLLLGRSTAGAGVGEAIACTAAGRALIDDANAAAQLATLGALPLAGGTMSGNIVLGEGADPATSGIVLDVALSADERYSGITIPGTAGATLAFGDLCFLDPVAGNNRWELADANVVTTYSYMLGMCVDASTDGNATSMLLLGTIRSAAFPTGPSIIGIGAPAYVSTTAGDITGTAPLGVDNMIRIVGYGIASATIYFNPSNDYITHI